MVGQKNFKKLWQELNLTEKTAVIDKAKELVSDKGFSKTMLIALVYQIMLEYQEKFDK